MSENIGEHNLSIILEDKIIEQSGFLRAELSDSSEYCADCSSGCLQTDMQSGYFSQHAKECRYILFSFSMLSTSNVILEPKYLALCKLEYTCNANHVEHCY